MTPVIILAVVALLFSLFLFWQVLSRYSRPAAIQTNRAELVPVDIEAFENLTDPEEERFLRSNLPPPEFRRVQRLRLRAAKVYIAALSQNAGLLVKIGQAASLNADPEIAAPGRELLQQAIRLKLFCLFSWLRIRGAFLFPIVLSPSNKSPSNKLARRYMSISYMAANLTGRAAA
ncbi:MAG: hypothetical protein WCB53_10275 [Terriglobales bacterium]